MTLQRFLDAHESDGMYELALAECIARRKYSHWIWYILPQLALLGHSENARFFGIADIAEARAYYLHPVLGARLGAITAALAPHVAAGTTLTAVMGHVDALKTISCLTLFTNLNIPDAEQPAWHAGFRRDAALILEAGVAEGLPACTVTLSAVMRASDPVL